MDGISPNSIYAFILARSRVGVLPVIFHKLAIESFGPCKISEVSFHSILENKWMEFHQSTSDSLLYNLPKF